MLIRIFLLHSFFILATSATALEQNSAVFRIEEKVYWGNQLPQIIKNIEMLDCVFGESTLLNLYRPSPSLKKLGQCAADRCDANSWGKFHRELLFVLTVSKAVELLNRRGGTAMSMQEQEKLLAPNAKNCQLPSLDKWPHSLADFINAEIMYQDMLAEGGSNSAGKSDSKQTTFKNDVEALSHVLFYVPNP